MTDKKYVVGIDGGTEGIRVGIFTLDGTPVVFAAEKYTTSFPRPGWAEQSPDDWWRSLGVAMNRALAESGVSKDDILGLAADTTCCSVVALDAEMRPLRDAIIWMDVRADAEAEAVLATGDAALQVNNGGKGPVSAEWMLSKSLWINRNQPEIWEQAAVICEYQDYLNYQMTGELVASINNASIRWHYRADKGGFPVDLLAALSIPELAEKWPSDVLGLGEAIGGLTPAAAAHLGLNPGTTVAQGGADAFIAMLGLGVVKTGQLAFITGSSHLHLGNTDSAVHGDGIWGTYNSALRPGQHVIEGGQTSTGSIIAWFHRMIGEPDMASLNEEAAAIAPGADGLVVLDHFQGNRTPFTDAASRGCLNGLSLSHTRGHIFRALMEGIGYGTELILENFRTGGFTPSEMVICGGATNSELWMQIHADISNLPIIKTRVADAPALGSAMLAGICGGAFSSFEQAADAMVQVERRIEPDPDRHAVYRDLIADYKALYPALRDIRR